MKIVPLALVLLAATACGGPEDTSTQQAAAPPVSADVTLALAVSAALTAQPASSDSVLAVFRLTRPGLDSLLYRIAADSTMSRQYSAGRP